MKGSTTRTNEVNHGQYDERLVLFLENAFCMIKLLSVIILSLFFTSIFASNVTLTRISRDVNTVCTPDQIGVSYQIILHIYNFLFSGSSPVLRSLFGIVQFRYRTGQSIFSITEVWVIFNKDKFRSVPAVSFLTSANSTMRWIDSLYPLFACQFLILSLVLKRVYGIFCSNWNVMTTCIAPFSLQCINLQVFQKVSNFYDSFNYKYSNDIFLPHHTRFKYSTRNE